MPDLLPISCPTCETPSTVASCKHNTCNLSDLPGFWHEDITADTYWHGATQPEQPADSQQLASLSKVSSEASSILTGSLQMIFESPDQSISPTDLSIAQRPATSSTQYVSSISLDWKRQKRKQQNRRAQQNYRARQELRVKDLEDKLCAAKLQCRKYEEVILQLQTSLETSLPSGSFRRMHTS